MTPGRPWRRRLVRAAVCLLLGAVTTVGVAWGIAWRLQLAPAYIPGRALHPMFVVEREQVEWMGYEWHAAGFRTVVLSRARPQFLTPEVEAHIASTPRRELESLPPWTYWPAESALIAGRPAAWPSPWTHSCQTQAYGWPMLAMRGAVIEGQWPDWIDYWLPRDRSSRHAYPVGVVAIGFLLNTLCYAAAWWILPRIVTWGGRSIRRRRRRRRGCCAHCGYDLSGLAAGKGGTAVCPECGA